MGNMSYCRFRNTEQDLADCESALETLLEGDIANSKHGELSISDVELKAAAKLVERCANILRLIQEAAGVDDDIDDIEQHAHDTLYMANESAKHDEAESAKNDEAEFE